MKQIYFNIIIGIFLVFLAIALTILLIKIPESEYKNNCEETCITHNHDYLKRNDMGWGRLECWCYSVEENKPVRFW